MCLKTLQFRGISRGKGGVIKTLVQGQFNREGGRVKTEVQGQFKRGGRGGFRGISRE